MTASASTSIPAVPGLPVLGNTLNLSNTITMPHFLAASRRQYGPVFTLSAPGMRITALVGPEANVFASREGHRVLRSREAWRPNDRELGTEKSMISEDGEIHRAFRRVQGRSFNRSQFSATLPLSSAVVAEDLAPLRAGDSLAVAAWSKRVVTEQLARGVVGGTARPYLPDLLTFIQTALMATVTRQLPGVVLRHPKYRRAKANIMRMVEDLMEQHRAQPAAETGRAPDLLDDALAAQRENPDLWTDRDVRMAALGAFIAGMDTAANTLAFVLYRLHRHEERLPAIRAEVDALFDSGDVSSDALGRLGHLHHFVMETMRLHPIAPALSRTATQDFEFGGHTVREGSALLIATTAPHFMEEVYREPLTFDPARFAAGRAEHRQPGAYAPFGVGTHICAGSGMAEGLIMLNVAAILRTLDLELDPTYPLRQVARPTPCPDDGLQLRVRAVRHDPQSLFA